MSHSSSIVITPFLVSSFASLSLRFSRFFYLSYWFSIKSPCTYSSCAIAFTFLIFDSFIRFLQKRSYRFFLMSAIFFIAWIVFTYTSRLYCTGSFLTCSNQSMLSFAIYLLFNLRQALVQAHFLGLCLALKCLWHFARQNLNERQSFLMNKVPWPG